MEQVRLCTVCPMENWLGISKTTYRVGWLIWICYSRALERRCLGLPSLTSAQPVKVAVHRTLIDFHQKSSFSLIVLSFLNADPIFIRLPDDFGVVPNEDWPNFEEWAHSRWLGHVVVVPRITRDLLKEGRGIPQTQSQTQVHNDQTWESQCEG